MTDEKVEDFLMFVCREIREGCIASQLKTMRGILLSIRKECSKELMCAKELLSRKFTRARVAKELNMDESLVSRIARGFRIRQHRESVKERFVRIAQQTTSELQSK